MRTVVFKLSGKVLDNFFTNDIYVKKINELREIFNAVILVHGAGIKITEWSQAFGLTPVFHNGLRVTDQNTMDVVAAVQSGLMNAKLVANLQANNINAVGLTGTDFNLFKADKINDELGFVGIPVPTGRSEILFSLLRENIIPVFSSTCSDKQGNLMNINADTFAKEIAVLVNAEAVLFLSDIDGVMLDNSIQSLITIEDINDGISLGQITDGMIPKLQNCVDLLNNGISKVWIGRDLAAQNIKEIFTSTSEANTNYSINKGTWIVRSKLFAA